MGLEVPKIIDELEFVLTHPEVNVKQIERFYNNWLFLYDSVPLLIIIDHMKKVKPHLLKEWSIYNKTVLALLKELEPENIEVNTTKQIITINIDLTGEIPSHNGNYQVPWKTEIEGPIVNAYFKTNSLLVIDKIDGRLILSGICQFEHNQYHLYVKKGRKSI